MNFLVHSYLSLPYKSEDILFGNFIGDFVKGNLEKTYFSEEIKNGIKLHRKIDSFADESFYFKKSRKCLPPEIRRYTGIIVDIFYDYAIANEWSKYSNISFEEFVDNIYQIIDERKKYIPEKSKIIYENIKKYGVLYSYKNLNSIERTLRSIEMRLGKSIMTEKCISILESEKENFFEDFKYFIEEIQKKL